MELAVVLVILGLLAGGIMAGKALIRKSDLSQVINDYNRYVIATQAFIDKYGALPGDIQNATDFWGAADNGDGTGADCISVQSNDFKTCNGNGDSNIDNFTAGVSVEYARAWQQLAGAGLISGRFTGTNGPGGSLYDTVPGWNVPEGKIPGSGYALHSRFTNNAYNYHYFLNFNYSTRLMFGIDNETGSVIANTFTPNEMWGIDSKMDDGRPGSGTIMSSNGSSDGSDACSTTQDFTTAAYNRRAKTKLCILVGQPGF